MGFRKETGNRALNTVGIVPRTLGTGLHAIEDATKSALFSTLNVFEGFGKTATTIKDAVNKACTEGPWYKKLWKAPASIITSPIMAIEGAGETLFYSGCNLLRHTRDTIANPFINFGHGFKRLFSSQDPWNFKFEKVTTSDVTPNNYIAKWFS